jgi:hypothetical protein
MVHAIRLVETTGQRALAARLWATVFPHDLARLHDGECHRHGADAFFDETDGAIAVGERHFE